MKKQVSLICIALLLVSFVSLSAQSPYRWRWCPFNNSFSRLNLTPEQIKKYENLYQGFLKEIDPIERDLISKSQELRRVYFNSVPDNMAIVKKQREISALQLKLQEKIFNYRLEALGILTTEQIVLLPSDCSLGFIPGRGFGWGYGRGFGRGYGLRNGWGYGRGYGYGRGFGRGPGRGRGMGFYYGRARGMGRNAGYYPLWWR